jgi:hypothetical protein
MPTPDELEDLLTILCVKLGFCLHGEAYDRLVDNPPKDPATFTDAVFEAEGMDPRRAERGLYSQVLSEVEKVVPRANSE